MAKKFGSLSIPISTMPRKHLELPLPITVKRAIDGDTLEVTISFDAIVRLKDLYCEEKGTPEGEAATKNMKTLAEGQSGWLRIPLSPGNGLSRLFSFGRILGHVSVDEEDVASLQIRDGYGSRTKPK